MEYNVGNGMCIICIILFGKFCNICVKLYVFSIIYYINLSMCIIRLSLGMFICFLNPLIQHINDVLLALLRQTGIDNVLCFDFTWINHSDLFIEVVIMSYVSMITSIWHLQWEGIIPDSKEQSLWGQHGAHLGPIGPRWAPCWPHKLCIKDGNFD